MDLSTMTDVKELKALAFDQIGHLENAQQNLRAIQQRIAQLQEMEPAEEAEEEA